MRLTKWTVSCLALLTMWAIAALAQPPRGKGQGGPPDPAAMFAKLKAMDTNGDGAFSKDEISDPRLMPLFTKANTDGDDVVTQDELKALFAREAAGGGRGGPGGGGPGGPGGPGGGPGGEGFGPGGPGGPGGGPGGPGGGPGGRGRSGGRNVLPGQLLSDSELSSLNLNEKQRKQLTELQKTVNTRLENILTSEQQQQLLRPSPPSFDDQGPPPDGGPGGPGPGGPEAGGPGGPGPGAGFGGEGPKGGKGPGGPKRGDKDKE